MTSLMLLFLFLPCLQAMQMVHAPGTYPMEETKQDVPTVPKNPYQSTMGGGEMDAPDEPYKFYYEKEPVIKAPSPSAPSPFPNPISLSGGESPHRPATPTFSDSSLNPGTRDFPILRTDPDDPRYVNIKPKPQRIQTELWDDAQKNNKPIMPEIEVVPSAGNASEKPDSQPELYYEKESGYEGPTPPTFDPYKETEIGSQGPGTTNTGTSSGSGSGSSGSGSGAGSGSGSGASVSGSGAGSGAGSGSSGAGYEAGSGSGSGANRPGNHGGLNGKFGVSKGSAPGASPDDGTTAEFPDPDSLTKGLGRASSWESYSSQEKLSSGSGANPGTKGGSMKVTIAKGGKKQPGDISREDGAENIFSKSTHNAPGPFDPQIAVSASRARNSRYESNESSSPLFTNNDGSGDSTASGRSGHGASSSLGKTSSSSSFAPEHMHRIDSDIDFEAGASFTNPSSSSSAGWTSTSFGGSGHGHKGDSSRNQGTGQDGVLGQVTFPPESNPSHTNDARLQPSSNKKNCCACCKDDEKGKTYTPVERNYEKESKGDFGGVRSPIVREGDGYKETVRVAEIAPYEPSQAGVPAPQNIYQPKSSSQYRERPLGVGVPVQTAYPQPSFGQIPSQQAQWVPAPVSDAEVLGSSPGAGTQHPTMLLSNTIVRGAGFNPITIGTGTATATQFATHVAPASYGVGPQFDSAGSYGAQAQTFSPAGSCGCAQQQPVIQQTCCQPVQPCCMPTIPCCPPLPTIPCCPPISLCCQPQPCCPPPPTCCQQAAVPQCYRACPSCPCRRRMHASLRMKRSPGLDGKCSACSASGQHMPGRKKRQTGCRGGCNQSANPLMGLFNHSHTGSCGTRNQSHKRTKRFGCLPCLGGRKKRSAEEEEEHKRVKRFGCLPCLGGRKKRSAAQSNCHSCSNLGHILARAKRTICSPCGRKKRDVEAVRHAPCPCAQNKSVAPPAQSFLINPLTTASRGKRSIDPGYDSIFTCDQSCCDYSKCNKMHAKRLHRKIVMN